jgi:hypothetical protein
MNGSESEQILDDNYLYWGTNSYCRIKELKDDSGIKYSLKKTLIKSRPSEMNLQWVVLVSCVLSSLWIFWFLVWEFCLASFDLFSTPGAPTFGGVSRPPPPAPPVWRRSLPSSSLAPSCGRSLDWFWKVEIHADKPIHRYALTQQIITFKKKLF